MVVPSIQRAGRRCPRVRHRCKLQCVGAQGVQMCAQGERRYPALSNVVWSDRLSLLTGLGEVAGRTSPFHWGLGKAAEGGTFAEAPSYKRA